MLGLIAFFIVAAMQNGENKDDFTAPATGNPAGSAFEPSGWWNIRVTGLANQQNRLLFSSDERFSGTVGNPPFGSLPAAGSWSYDPASSALRMSFVQGNWLLLPLRTEPDGFSSFIGFGALQTQYHFTRDP